MKPSPGALWYQAQREHPDDAVLRKSRFQSLMRLHGHIVPKTPENEAKHNHVTRDIKPCGSGCPACDDYHWRRRAESAGLAAEETQT